MNGPCLCGDPECPVCGSLQGFPVDDVPEEKGRDMKKTDEAVRAVRSQRRNDTAFWVLLTFAVLMFGCGLWATFSRFEAIAFNALTGQSVTTFQAMFVELRVDCRR